MSINFCNNYSHVDSTINYLISQNSSDNNTINSCLKDSWIIVIYDKKGYSGVILEIKENILITQFAKLWYLQALTQFIQLIS